jgi:hypothetical protein
VETVSDFEDLLGALGRHRVRYLIIGGLAFIYHAKPRYTKDLDLWIAPDPDNIERANAALAEFGSPHLLSADGRQEILQLGLPPNRIDLLRETGGVDFDDAWREREDAPYGDVPAHWIGLDALIAIKRQIDHPRHQEDVRVLEAVRRRRRGDEG